MKAEFFSHTAQKVNIDGITFDSKLEAKVYRILRLYKNSIEIKVHSPISTGWKVDFDLLPKNHRGVLLLHKLSQLTGCNYPSRILLEVKGILDKNFIKRYKEISGTPFESQLVLVSRECGAIGYKDPNSLSVVVKPIASVTLIRDILAM